MITPDNFTCNVGDVVNFTDMVTTCSGFQYNAAPGTNWTSSNPNAATIDTNGVMSAWSAGSMTIVDNLSNVGVYSGQMCAPAPSCPQGNPHPQASGNVAPKVTSVSPARGPDWNYHKFDHDQWNWL